VEEFARVMKESGQNPSDEEVQQIIKEVDLDGDGTINFDGKNLTYPFSNCS
jgi:Ca2+-binding EF-hand superfamily protein